MRGKRKGVAELREAIQAGGEQRAFNHVENRSRCGGRSPSHEWREEEQQNKIQRSDVERIPPSTSGKNKTTGTHDEGGEAHPPGVSAGTTEAQRKEELDACREGARVRTGNRLLASCFVAMQSCVVIVDFRSSRRNDQTRDKGGRSNDRTRKNKKKNAN